MAHALIPGIDRVAATRARTIWHQAETMADGRLTDVVIVGDDNEGALLAMAGIVLPASADNDVVGTVPIWAEVGDEFTASSKPIETHMATVSASGRVLGVVTAGYQFISLSTVIKQWLLALIRAGGVPETLGTFNGGSDFFASVQVSDEWMVPGDHSATRPLFNVLGNHGAKRALLGSMSSMRLVCQNTSMMYAAAHSTMTSAEDRTKAAWVSVRHTANASERIQDAVEWIIDGRARAESEKALMARLAAQVVSAQEVDKFISSYIAIPKGASKGTVTVRSRNRDEFVGVLSDEADLGNHVMTAGSISAYGLLQAVTRFEDWTSQINRKGDTPVGTRRAFRAFLGEREAEKATARDRIMEMVGVM